MMIGGPGIGLGLRGKSSNTITLPAGCTYIPPAGNYIANLGPYTSLQYLDPVTGNWRTQADADTGNGQTWSFDGSNQRLANLTGCPVAAIIVTGSATGSVTGIGTTATTLTVTPSSGSSTWCPIVGGAVAPLALTGTTGGKTNTGFLYPPSIVISAPPPGGLQATAHILMTGGAGTLTAISVIVDNQGAGYTQPPTIQVTNDPRDTVGSWGGTTTLGLTGTGTLTGLYPLNQGVSLTGVSTLAISTCIGSAIVVMNFTVTNFVAPTPTGTWQTATTPGLVSVNNLAASTSSMTNPIHQGGATFPRPARITTALSGTLINVTGSVIEDAGFGIQLIPNFSYVGSIGTI